ncbi:hypothetical protein BV25DRAFT_1843084 [Artomyces pyxidatus]|uniref:Uncharacterized protein n=1 Tax=Artomyces pyxidatus TaxID=48021 RepID=A0ACB8SGB6_9AGAM|nr:hypothetical protein BV25DRAFT_1843084 [Artomyces pyxidatus]
MRFAPPKDSTIASLRPILEKFAEAKTKLQGRASDPNYESDKEKGLQRRDTRPRLGSLPPTDDFVKVDAFLYNCKAIYDCSSEGGDSDVARWVRVLIASGAAVDLIARTVWTDADELDFEERRFMPNSSEALDPDAIRLIQDVISFPFDPTVFSSDRLKAYLNA